MEVAKRKELITSMNQQRLQSYINLIQKLLKCPSGEEWILLRQNEALVTPELAQVMEQVATQLAHQGNIKEAKFLHNLAGQIHHLFVAQTVPRTSNEDQLQAYLELIKTLLACPQGSENELLAANQELIGPGLVHTMQQVAAEMAANGDQETSNYLQHWAKELNRLWVQNHEFLPVWKKDAEPKPSEIPLTTAPLSFPQTEIPQFSQSVAKTDSPPSVEDEQDVWAELSEEPESPSLQSLPTPELFSPQATPIQEAATDPLAANRAIYEQISHQLEAITGALTKLCETLAHSPQRSSDPLWYMEVLERASVGNWVLTSAEIQKLIGVQPACHKDSDPFQRGCWIFTKAGKIGTQTGWRVTKAHEGE